MANKILIISHSPVGNFLQSLGAMAAIRREYEGDEIMLLTDAVCAPIGAVCPYVNEVHIDPMPDRFAWKTAWELRKWYKAQKFTHVFDLSDTKRTDNYFRFIGFKKPFWSGNVSWCSHPFVAKNRSKMHVFDRLREQLKIAGIARTPKPKTEWLKADVKAFKLPKKFAVLVLDGAEFEKKNIRWHAYGFADVANWCARHEVEVLCVANSKKSIAFFNEINRLSKDVELQLLDKDLLLSQVASVVRKSQFVLGGNVAAVHLAAIAGINTIMLMQEEECAARVAPKVDNVIGIEEASLHDLDGDDVVAVIEKEFM